MKLKLKPELKLELKLKLELLYPRSRERRQRRQTRAPRPHWPPQTVRGRRLLQRPCHVQQLRAPFFSFRQLPGAWL